jgi:hypothetical protein
MRVQAFEVGAALGALEDKVGAVPGAWRPVDRLHTLLAPVLQREAEAAAGRAVPAVLHAGQHTLTVQGQRESCDVVQSVLDELRREPLPRFHVTCTVLVMPWEVAEAHGLATDEVQEADVAAMTNLMRDVVKQKGTLLNLPETIARPLVPFVAEPRIGAVGKQPPDDAKNLWLRGEAVAVSPEEALFRVQLLRNSLPEDRSVLPRATVCDRAFRLRVGNGVTMTMRSNRTSTVVWLRFLSTSTVAPKADRPDKAGGR